MLACQRQGALGITGLQSTRQRLNDRCFVLEKRKNRTSSFFLYVCHVRQSIQGKIQKGKNDKQNEEVRFFHEGTLFFACQQGKKTLVFCLMSSQPKAIWPKRKYYLYHFAVDALQFFLFFFDTGWAKIDERQGALPDAALLVGAQFNWFQRQRNDDAMFFFTNFSQFNRWKNVPLLGENWWKARSIDWCRTACRHNSIDFRGRGLMRTIFARIVVCLNQLPQ